MKKHITLLLLAIICFSCNKKPLYFKKITTPKCEVQWYYYSHITSESPNYVEVSVGNQTDIICESDNIADVNVIDGDSIILYFYGSPSLYNGSAQCKTSVNGLAISIDSLTYKQK